jgi:asparagine synthase (glutamine-hydrolysing)
MTDDDLDDEGSTMTALLHHMPTTLRRAPGAAPRRQRTEPLRREWTIQAVRGERITYLEGVALRDLWRRVEELERRGAQGAIVEAGCALGGSAIVLAAAKSPRRRLEVYDVFGMIPPPSEVDGEDVKERYRTIASGASTGIGGDPYYGYEEDLLGRVRDTFDRYGLATGANDVHLVRGLYEDTLHPAGPVALAHVDADWYESVKTCLDRIVPMLVEGGTIVLDDYDAWSGCRIATDEFLAAHPGVLRTERHARVHLVRASAPLNGQVA